MGSCYSYFTDKSEENKSDVIDKIEEIDKSDGKIHYPPHEPRTNSSLYNKTHRKMKDMTCFICNKHGIETHHYFCEWAAENAIDWIKFGESSKYLYNPQTGENINIFDWEQVSKNPTIFVDSPQNMITLCKQHHTSRQ